MMKKRMMKRLMKRQTEGEINVCLTDKSSNWAVMERETYLKLGAVHTAKDEKVTRDYSMDTPHAGSK